MTADALLTPLSLKLTKPASHTCARAFAEDPSNEYLIPDEAKRRHLHYSFEYYLRYSYFGRNEVYLTSKRCEGVACWASSEETDSWLTRWRAGYPFLPLHCGWTSMQRGVAANKESQRLLRDHAPDRVMQLDLIAVDPKFQGQGFASMLLRPMLHRLDNDDMPCYLETQSLRNVEMYRRFGFELKETAVIPGTNFPLFAMLRPPRPVMPASVSMSEEVSAPLTEALFQV
ncbi:GNAT family N-acetyltransferase [Dehalogenimonas sp. THU2]|uniref:GNAT family N-acetyltransferase n=1 Tax=Dehalogenimonas sp. THU2 TaxID=3151121 RepID=UPI0032188A69